MIGPMPTTPSRGRPSPSDPRDSAAVSPPRPTPADLEAARGRTIPDLIAPDLRVLFCGINPGLWSGATGFHFARPGNRFWKVLREAGFTHRVLQPSEGAELLRAGFGITNLVPRTTASEAELRREEFVEGAERLRVLVADYRPHVLAFVGIGAYRTGFADARAVVGPQAASLGDTRLWVLPNPSGLNASYQMPALVDAFGALRRAVAG
jgi:double-stranded uracil-DNA glycosylase